MSKNSLNISVMFLLPGIEIKSDIKKKFRNFGFTNSYITCEPFRYPYNTIFLLFEPDKLDYAFYEFTEELQKNKNFIEIIDLNNKVIIVYRIPKKFDKDYSLFIEGAYSLLSKEFKDCFVLEDYRRDDKGNIVKVQGKPILEATTFYHVFNKTDILKDRWKEKLGYDLDATILDNMELYEKQDEEKETYSPEIDIW